MIDPLDIYNQGVVIRNTERLALSLERQLYRQQKELNAIVEYLGIEIVDGPSVVKKERKNELG